jgi:hypothetical protein
VCSLSSSVLGEMEIRGAGAPVDLFLVFLGPDFLEDVLGLEAADIFAVFEGAMVAAGDRKSESSQACSYHQPPPRNVATSFVLFPAGLRR